MGHGAAKRCRDDAEHARSADRCFCISPARHTGGAVERWWAFVNRHLLRRRPAYRCRDLHAPSPQRKLGSSVFAFCSVGKATDQERFEPLRGPSHFSLFGQRKVTQREATPAWRLPGVLPGKSVSRGRAFRQDFRQLLLRCSTSDIPVLACPDEKESTSVSTPLRAFSSPTHRRTGAPVEQSGGPSWPALGTPLLLRPADDRLAAAAIPRPRHPGGSRGPASLLAATSRRDGQKHERR